MCRTTTPHDVHDVKNTIFRCFCCCKVLIVAAAVLAVATGGTLAAYGANTASRDDCIAAAKEYCDDKKINATAKVGCATGIFECASKGHLLSPDAARKCPGVDIANGDVNDGCEAWNNSPIPRSLHFRG